MDIPRQPPTRRRRWLLIGGALGAVVLATVGLSRLKPAAPTVDRGSAIIDSVRRGPLVIEVRGPGTLVPEQIRWVTAVTAGRVERRLVEPGQVVTPETVLLVLSNPDVQLQALESERQLTAAQAEKVNVRVTLETQRLNQQGVVATTEADEREARRQAAVADSLVAKGMISQLEAARAHDKALELATRLGVERGRLTLYSQAIDSQLGMQQAQVNRLRAVDQFQRDRITSMNVRAGAAGVVQELPLEVGQWAQSGATLAKVVQPGKLKAVLRIPETQAKDVVVGQPASIDTRNGLIRGHVMRTDPASQNGTVTVDVALDDSLPRGARPDLSVDGTIEVERIPNTLAVGRPAYGQSDATVGLFRLVEGGQYAERVSVRLGRSSVNTVQVVSGLREGDRVIISDMSRYDAVDRVKLE
jgi:multidrug resistance efflux pump